MSSLVLLVRHGQASFGKARYDELSPLGACQGEVLGAALGAQGWTFDRIVSGGLRRHEQTAAAVVSQLDSPPAISVDSDWDEFDHDAVVRAYRPEFADQASMVRALAAHQEPRREFQRIFLEATARWQSGEHDGYPETFSAFVARGRAALTRLVEQGGTSLVVTSGGPIAALTSLALTGEATLWSALNEVTVNTSVTKLLVGRRPRPTLLSFNDHSHLEHDRTLITYR